MWAAAGRVLMALICRLPAPASLSLIHRPCSGPPPSRGRVALPGAGTRTWVNTNQLPACPTPPPPSLCSGPPPSLRTNGAARCGCGTSSASCRHSLRGRASCSTGEAGCWVGHGLQPAGWHLAGSKSTRVQREGAEILVVQSAAAPTSRPPWIECPSARLWTVVSHSPLCTPEPQCVQPGRPDRPSHM